MKCCLGRYKPAGSQLALEEPELSPREIAVRFTDRQSYFVSGGADGAVRAPRWVLHATSVAWCRHGRPRYTVGTVLEGPPTQASTRQPFRLQEVRRAHSSINQEHTREQRLAAGRYAGEI